MISRGVLGVDAGDAAAPPEICCPQEGGVCRSLCRTVDLKGVERCRFRSESARSERLCKSGIYPIVDRLVKNREKSELMEEVPGRCSRSSRPTRDQIHPEKVSAKSLGPVVGHGASPIRSWCDTLNLGIFVQKFRKLCHGGIRFFAEREQGEVGEGERQ